MGQSLVTPASTFVCEMSQGRGRDGQVVGEETEKVLKGECGRIAGSSRACRDHPHCNCLARLVCSWQVPLGGVPRWCLSPQGQPWASGHEQAATRPIQVEISMGLQSLSLIPMPPLDRHLAQNPFICDCNLKWLADFLRTNPIETSGARCASPRRLANKRIGQIKSKKFRCSGSCPTAYLPSAQGPHDVSRRLQHACPRPLWTHPGVVGPNW